MYMYEFRLYVVGDTPSSKKATTSLKSLLEDEFKGRYSLEVVDVLENPQIADSEHIFATPTLVKTLPPPSRKILGDISNREKVLVGLDLLDR
jgi:circadian clock protein KaiB